MKNAFFQLIRYVAVGSVASVMDMGSYLVFTRGFDIGPVIGNILAYSVGNLVSFAGHHIFTFHSDGHPAAEYPRFLVVTIVGLGISQAVLVLIIGAGVSDIFGKGSAVIVSGLFNFTVNRLWTFRPTQSRT